MSCALCSGCDAPMRRISREYHPQQDVVASNYICENCTKGKVITKARDKPMWFHMRYSKVVYTDIDHTIPKDG